MPWPSNLDADPNLARMRMETVLTITSTSGNITNPMLGPLGAAITTATRVAPLSLVISGGAAIATMPADRELWDYIGNVMSAMAAAGYSGAVTGFEQGRILPA